MSIEVLPATDADTYLATDLLVWSERTHSLAPTMRDLGIPVDQRFAVDLPDGPDGTYAGIYGVRPLTLSLPGGRLEEVAGLTWVGVHPDCRRRGVLSAMLRDHFVRVRETGGGLSLLHASEPGIYGRFGYGLAALEAEVALSRGTTFTAPGLEKEAAALTTRLVDAASPGVTARLRRVALRAAPERPGTVVGDEGFTDLEALDVPELDQAKEPRRALFAQRDGEDVGCVVLRRTPRWDDARAAGTVRAGFFFAPPAARLALLRRLVDLDLTSRVTLEHVGLDDPLLDWLPGPRGASDLRTYDSTWVRLVDLATAWSLRSYDAACDVVVEVEDAHAPWNAGRWHLSTRGGEGRAVRTEDAADVSLGVDVLGAGFLGRSVAGLLRSGLVTEHRAGAYLELARALRTDLPPAASIGF